MGIIAELRRELKDVNREILEAPSVTRPSMDVLRKFVLNQLYIVPHDLRALSHALTKARDDLELDFVKGLVDGDYEALKSLRELAEELGVGLDYNRLSPRAVSYTHFLQWLALHGTMGDLAVAMTVNLPVWGENCRRLGEWAESQGVKATRFFKLFSGPWGELEARAEEIAGRYLDWDRYRFIARAIQFYEKEFWLAIA
jgi:thiaminase